LEKILLKPEVEAARLKRKQNFEEEKLRKKLTRNPIEQK
jgi:hypothetical protein